MINKETFTKYSQLALLITTALVLIFWRYVQLFVPELTIERVLGVFAAIMSSMFLYFDSRLSAAIRGPIRPLTHMSLNDCFNQIARQYRHIGRMRIFAVSSGRIHPLFSSSNIQVDKCDILLRDFTDAEVRVSRNAEYQRHINDIVSEWERDREKGKVKKLAIDRFFFIPTEYYIIFDDKAMVLGTYMPTSDGWSDVIEPVFIQNSSTEGAELIRKYAVRFDQLKRLLCKGK